MKIVPLISWDAVLTGACHWTNERQCVPCDTPGGVELRVEPASKSAPLVREDKPWEADRLAWGQVMRDGGLYRMWYGVSATPPLLCYAESNDAMTWRKPELGLVEYDGSTANNICYRGLGANHFSVFIDPTAPPQARYRCMIFKSWWEGAPGEVIDGEEGMRRLNARNAAASGEEVLPVALKGVMAGLNSPDGLRWTPIEKPILEEWHDTHNICLYDEAAGKYRAYLRGGYGGRRAISYSETDDFEHWPPSRVIHHQLVTDEPGASLYSNCYTRYPDVAGVHLMFPANYHLDTDKVDGELAVSMDGLNWTRHTRAPIVPCGAPGDVDEAHVYPEPDLLRFRDEGKFRLLCRVGNCYHNEAYNDLLKARERQGAYQWAEWQEDRLAGVRAEEEGVFTIHMQPCGERMMANFRTEPDGWVKFELVDRVAWPPIPWDGIEGYRFDDMTPLTGDQTHCPVTWQGRADLSALKGKSVAVRVRLCKATLFSITMYGADDEIAREDPRYPV